MQRTLSKAGMSSFNPIKSAPTAGKVTTIDKESTGACLKFDRRPITPHNVRKFRKSYFIEPGRRIVHYGLIDDLEGIDASRRHGKATNSSEHVKDVFPHGPQTDMAVYLNDRKEAIYRTHKKEPLGRSQQHALSVDPNKKFGIATNESESAKNLMYPRNTSATMTESDAGKQRDRGYDWAAAHISNPSTHRFGRVQETVADGVMMCLNPTRDPTQKRVVIVPKTLDDLMVVRDDGLGMCKNLGQHNEGDEGRTFGIVTLPLATEGAAQCIRGNYSEQEQAPDRDLGRSVAPGWRNTTTDTRAFGVPTIRTDVAKPKMRSISDNQNYGDDSSAKALLYPSDFAARGVGASDFSQPRSREEVKAVFTSVGCSLTSEEFDKVWDTALLHTSGNNNRSNELSISTFRKFLNLYLDAQQEQRRK